MLSTRNRRPKIHISPRARPATTVDRSPGLIVRLRLTPHGATRRPSSSLAGPLWLRVAWDTSLPFPWCPTPNPGCCSWCANHTDPSWRSFSPRLPSVMAFLPARLRLAVGGSLRAACSDPLARNGRAHALRARPIALPPNPFGRRPQNDEFRELADAFDADVSRSSKHRPPNKKSSDSLPMRPHELRTETFKKKKNSSGAAGLSPRPLSTVAPRHYPKPRNTKGKKSQTENIYNQKSPESDRWGAWGRPPPRRSNTPDLSTSRKQFALLPCLTAPPRPSGPFLREHCRPFFSPPSLARGSHGNAAPPPPQKNAAPLSRPSRWSATPTNRLHPPLPWLQNDDETLVPHSSPIVHNRLNRAA